MTPKEKAIQLYEDMFYKVPATKKIQEHDKAAIDCALVAVTELVNSYAQYTGMYDQEFFTSERQYWENVKKELKNIF
jgi:hypothetical protein